MKVGTANLSDKVRCMKSITRVDVCISRRSKINNVSSVGKSDALKSIAWI